MSYHRKVTLFISVVSFILFLIVNAISTGQKLLVEISFLLISLSLVMLIQFIIFTILSKIRK